MGQPMESSEKLENNLIPPHASALQGASLSLREKRPFFRLRMRQYAFISASMVLTAERKMMHFPACLVRSRQEPNNVY